MSPPSWLYWPDVGAAPEVLGTFSTVQGTTFVYRTDSGGGVFENTLGYTNSSTYKVYSTQQTGAYNGGGIVIEFSDQTSRNNAVAAADSFQLKINTTNGGGTLTWTASSGSLVNGPVSTSAYIPVANLTGPAWLDGVSTWGNNPEYLWTVI